MARRQINDAYTKMAQREGYVARSAYKLLEIQERYKVIRKGDRVLDLGCSPGSWLQVAVKLAGRHGVVAGVDLKPVHVSLGPNVRTLEGDAFARPASELLALAGVDRYDTLLSDMAPNTTGDPRSDHFKSINLATDALGIAPQLLVPDGTMVIKVFEGEAYPDFMTEMKRNFRFVKGFRPKATRDVSREMFVIAQGFKKAEPMARDAAPPAGASDTAPEA